MTRKWAGIAGAAALFLLIIIILITVLTRPGTASVIPPTVVTETERYEGIKRNYEGSMITRYAGIPFAQPPVGELRFQPPRPLPPQTEYHTTSAQRLKKSCHSITRKTSSPYYDEDCLYLNVYVPDSCDSNNKCSVVVWIHGGGFVAGNVFPEPYRFVSRGGVIVVTFNYRLGVFGFLTTEDASLPRNNGLWDQVFAFRWVKENINYFGGDENSITLFGESAGAISAALHALSPVTKDYFNRFLMQSGSATSFLQRNPTDIALQFGEKVGCGGKRSYDFAACLRDVDIETLLTFSDAADISDAGRLTDFIWMPTIDGQIITDEPANLLNNRVYLAELNAFNKDYLFGLNNNDGSLAFNNFMYKLPEDVVIDMDFLKNYTNHLLTLTHDISPNALNNVSEIITSFYARSNHLSQPLLKQKMMDLLADAMFYAPETHMAKAMSACYDYPSSQACNLDEIQQSQASDCSNATGRSFMYVFDYCPPSEGCHPQCMSHGKQIQYQFPKKEFESSLDQQIADDFIDLLADFIKTGQLRSNATSEVWPAFERNLQSYLSFSPLPSVKQYFNQYRTDLWLSGIPKILEDMESA